MSLSKKKCDACDMFSMSSYTYMHLWHIKKMYNLAVLSTLVSYCCLLGFVGRTDKQIDCVSVGRLFIVSIAVVSLLYGWKINIWLLFFMLFFFPMTMELMNWCQLYSAVNQVKKIVEGSFPSFQSMYRPLIQEYIAEGLLKTSSYGQQKAFHQACVSFCSCIQFVETVLNV